MDDVEIQSTQQINSRRFTSKRIFDITVSSLLLILLFPFLLLIALLIRATSTGPALFRHKRVGLGGKQFYMYKFRTMVSDAEQLRCSFTPEQQAEFQSAFKLKKDPRVTAVGRILRKTSLDELPQFLNVLKGEMSIVGPRPVTREELIKYGRYTDMLLSVNPGITGLWQVSGRNDVSYDHRIKLDMKYISDSNFRMDLRIFFETLRIITLRLGAY